LLQAQSDCPVRFYAGMPDIHPPRRADATLGGAASHRASLYCQPFLLANSFGWYVDPPLDIDLSWDGAEVKWRLADTDQWSVLETYVSVQNFLYLAQHAPDAIKRLLNVPFLAVGPEAGIVQLWTGLFAISNHGWCSLVRGIVNSRQDPNYQVLEGIIDTDWWLGPLVFPIQIRRTDQTIRIRRQTPIVQIQPIHRACLSDAVLPETMEIRNVNNWSAEEWQRYKSSMEMKENAGKRGTYRAESRRIQRKYLAAQLPEQTG
jgi:hypothetical protein